MGAAWQLAVVGWGGVGVWITLTVRGRSNFHFEFSHSHITYCSTEIMMMMIDSFHLEGISNSTEMMMMMMIEQLSL